MDVVIGGYPRAFLDPVGIYNDPKVSDGSFGPTTSLVIATRSLLDFLLGWYYILLSMCKGGGTR